MNDASKPLCPHCGAPLPDNAPAGVCPRCLMAMNMATQTAFSDPEAASNPPRTSVPAPADLARLFPSLEILECLGRGGMGVVYKARQKSLNRLVALKILAPERKKDAAFAQRFAVEAETLAKLNHPGIVTVYDFGQTDGLFFLVMEFVDGVTLRQLLQTRRVSPREALAIVPQICDALQFAHDQGIVHRDIKPENILLDRRGRVKVADFGIAKMIAPEIEPNQPATEPKGERPPASPSESLTSPGSVVGTPAYMAPEQHAHPSDVDHRADIYSLGVVFYQMLTGELPAATLEPPSRRVQVDVRIDEIVLRALEKQPERRYQTADDFKTQVETVAETAVAPTTQPAPSHTPAQRVTSRWVSVVRWTARILGTLLLAGLGVFLLGEGLPAIASQPQGVQLTFLGGMLLVLGCLIGWRRDGWAALLCAGGWIVIRISESDFRLTTPFEIVLVISLLYTMCWWAACGRKTARAIALASALAGLLALGRLFCPANVFLSGLVTDLPTGNPVPDAALWLLPRPARTPGEPDSPNARTDKNGRFRLYVGWYAERKSMLVSASGHAELTTNLGPRALGQRRLSRDFQLAALEAAPTPEASGAQLRDRFAAIVPTNGGKPIVFSDNLIKTQTNASNWQERTLTVAAAGTAPLRYQWRRGGASIPVATNSALVLTNAQRGAAGVYDVQICISAMNAMDWRGALATANKVAALPPDEGLAIVRQYWTTVTNAESRKQFLKAFNFSKHPRQVAALELGILDPSLEVQNWAFGYLKEVALRDFTSDYSAAKTWIAERRDQLLPGVSQESVRRFTAELRDARGSALSAQLESLAQNSFFVRDNPTTYRQAGLDALLTELCASTNEAIALQAIHVSVDLDFGDDWARMVLLPRLGPGNPPIIREAVSSSLGRKGRDWALEPLLVTLTNLVLAATDARPWPTAQALAQIGSPKAIPVMIGLIEAENTYDTVYGIGYFGLGTLTGVSYDAQHDGAWWRLWWDKNKQRFPADVQAIEIPKFAPVEKARRTKSGKATQSGTAQPGVSAETHFAGGNTNQNYWLIRKSADTNPPPAGYRLLLVLPGGDGGPDFRPFLERVCQNALPQGYLLAELVAPRWDNAQFEQLVWPIGKNRYAAAKFTTEEFIAAVVKEVQQRHAVASNGVFALGWSSGGPAVYAASLDPRCHISGAFIAMSVFRPDQLPSLDAARGKSYYLLQSPEDFIPFRLVEQARQQLSNHGAQVRLETYEGGHGWRGDTYGMIRAGIRWIEDGTR